MTSLFHSRKKRRRRLRPGGIAPRVTVVGPCASGKTTLVNLLRKQRLDAHSVAQEHSSAPGMYLRAGPDYVVYLGVSYDEILRRRSVSWGRSRYRAQRKRLQRARNDADICIDTDCKSPAEICEIVMDFLTRRGEQWNRSY